MALTDFVDHLDAPGASFSALTSSSFPSVKDFSASTTSEAIKVDRFGAECSVSDCVYTYS